MTKVSNRTEEEYADSQLTSSWSVSLDPSMTVANLNGNRNTSSNLSMVLATAKLLPNRNVGRLLDTLRKRHRNRRRLLEKWQVQLDTNVGLDCLEKSAFNDSLSEATTDAVRAKSLAVRGFSQRGDA